MLLARSVEVLKLRSDQIKFLNNGINIDKTNGSAAVLGAVKSSAATKRITARESHKTESDCLVCPSFLKPLEQTRENKQGVLKMRISRTYFSFEMFSFDKHRKLKAFASETNALNVTFFFYSKCNVHFRKACGRR